MNENNNTFKDNHHGFKKGLVLGLVGVIDSRQTLSSYTLKSRWAILVTVSERNICQSWFKSFKIGKR